jgi:cytochrome b pre-mRNA-processing protein 3
MNYINIYNNLVTLTSNKFLYKNIKTKHDNFEDRLIFFHFHFAFFLKIYKQSNDKKILQEIYDFVFRQLELSIREIGYGDQTINKKMKQYINLFHGILLEINLWEDIDINKKQYCLTKFFHNFYKTDHLLEYFDNYCADLKKNNLNSYLKSVNK